MQFIVNLWMFIYPTTFKMNEADILAEETGLLVVFIQTVLVILELVHIYIHGLKSGSRQGTLIPAQFPLGVRRLS